MKKLGHICSIALAVALFSTCMGLVAIRTLGMGTFVVTGSSMEPNIHKGALVIVEPVSPSAVSRGEKSSPTTLVVVRSQSPLGCDASKGRGDDVPRRDGRSPGRPGFGRPGRHRAGDVVAVTNTYLSSPQGPLPGRQISPALPRRSARASGRPACRGRLALGPGDGHPGSLDRSPRPDLPYDTHLRFLPLVRGRG